MTDNFGNSIRLMCSFCGDDFSKPKLKRHMNVCKLNPKNIKICKNCNNDFRRYERGEFCSRKCANAHNNKLRSMENHHNWSGENYQIICFNQHKKECVVCGEKNIVAVHHYDENHDNNSPENLIPLCPTHHAYMHSSFKESVLSIVNKYREEFVRLSLNQIN